VRIIITGVPGTGKSVVSEELSKKLGIEIVKVTEFSREHGIGKKDGEELVIDEKVLERELKKSLPKEFILEGHMACEVKVPADFIFVLRVHPKILEKRLEKRGYSKQKLKDNLECEALDYCGVMAAKYYGKKAWEIPGDKIKDTIREILEIIEGKGKRNSFDFLDYFLEGK
jgi:adenylate kinase